MNFFPLPPEPALPVEARSVARTGITTLASLRRPPPWPWRYLVLCVPASSYTPVLKNGKYRTKAVSFGSSINSLFNARLRAGSAHLPANSLRGGYDDDDAGDEKASCRAYGSSLIFARVAALSFLNPPASSASRVKRTPSNAIRSLFTSDSA